jgi:hypothetical protein
MAHQADAAHWKEQEMFGLPGGIQLFTLFNLTAFSRLLGCFVAVFTAMYLQLRVHGYAAHSFSPHFRELFSRSMLPSVSSD